MGQATSTAGSEERHEGIIRVTTEQSLALDAGHEEDAVHMQHLHALRQVSFEWFALGPQHLNTMILPAVVPNHTPIRGHACTTAVTCGNTLRMAI